MEYYKTSESITKRVLNEASGTLEEVTFRSEKERKRIKGGFAMYYKSYEEAVANIINSKLDYTILLELKRQFTYARIECVISATELAKKLGCAKSKVSTIISAMVREQLLLKVARGVYRLNPYMVLPFKSDGELLQREWSQIVSEQKALSLAENEHTTRDS